MGDSDRLDLLIAAYKTSLFSLAIIGVCRK